MILRLLFKRTRSHTLSNYGFEALPEWQCFSGILIFLPVQLAIHFAANLTTALQNSEQFCGFKPQAVNGQVQNATQPGFARCTIEMPMPPFSHSDSFPFRLTHEQQKKKEDFLRLHAVPDGALRYFSPLNNPGSIRLNVLLGRRAPSDKLWPDPSYANMDHFLTSLIVLPCLPASEYPPAFHMPNSSLAEFVLCTIQNLRKAKWSSYSWVQKGQGRSGVAAPHPQAAEDAAWNDEDLSMDLEGSVGKRSGANPYTANASSRQRTEWNTTHKNWKASSRSWSSRSWQ